MKNFKCLIANALIILFLFSITPSISFADAAYDRAEKTVRSKFKRLDDTMKQSRYNQARWVGGLKSQTKNIVYAIKNVEKKWPDKAQPMWLGLKKRITIIQSNVLEVQKAKNKKLNDKKQARIAADEKRKQEKQQAEQAKQAKIKAKQVKKASLVISKLEMVKQQQAAYIKNGQVELWDSSTGNLKTTEIGSGYLSFSTDYNKVDNKISFNGKEFIYAHLHLPKKLTELLPPPDAKGMQYYQTFLRATVNERPQENDNKIQREADFTLAYNTKTLALAVVPEKAFFEDILQPYRQNGLFSDAATEEKALKDLLSRNFSRQMSYLFKDLTLGEHQVMMEFKVTAKLAGSKYVSLRNIKGTFLLKMDADAKQRYNDTFNMLTKLHRSYEGQLSIAQQRINMDKEKDMLASMTPREQERYKIAQRSPTGYMAAYGGERVAVSFHFGKLRTKNAYLDILWSKGSCTKCEEGTASVMVSKRSSKAFQIPKGASISLNGNTLIHKANEARSFPLYWFY